MDNGRTGATPNPAADHGGRGGRRGGGGHRAECAVRHGGPGHRPGGTRCRDQAAGQPAER